MTKPTLLYFKSRGRAELIRLVLAEAGIDYQEHHVGKGTAPSGGRPTDVAALAEAGALPFGAVPVWEEPGGLRLAQSAAIAAHLARSHGLLGRDGREIALVEQALGAVDDVRAEVRKLATTPAEDRPKVRAELAATVLPRWLGHLDKLLRGNGSGAAFLVGGGLTLADLSLWYLLELLRDNGFGPALDRFPVLSAHAARIASRPRIAAYLASPARPTFQPLPG